MKAGVIFYELSQRDHVQPALPGVCGISAPPGERERRLMAAVDALNRRHGRGTVQVASAGLRAALAGQADAPLAALHHEARRASEGAGERARAATPWRANGAAIGVCERAGEGRMGFETERASLRRMMKMQGLRRNNRPRHLEAPARAPGQEKYGPAAPAVGGLC